MSEQGSVLGFLSDPRLASYAVGGIPAWLWSADASRILWGNPAAAAIFNAASSTALTGHTIDPKGSAALQMARLAGTLPHGAAPRLERLRGFGGRMGGALMCTCSRISLADRTPAILVVAIEKAGPPLSIKDQARRLLTGCDAAAALFTSDGELLYATPAAQTRMGRATTLAALNVAALGATALAAGRADGDQADGRISLERLGAPGSIVLLATFLSPVAAVAATEPPPVKAAPPPRAAEPTPLPAPPRPSEPAPPAPDRAERRLPLRFVWQMDGDSRFTLDSDEFKTLIGPRTAAALGQPWNDLAAALRLDPDGQMARAFASHDTWSGIQVAFPVDGSDARLTVELSGLPVFDRDRNFRGYRGFGVCRDGARIGELTRTRRAPTPPAPRVEPPVFRDERAASASAPANVVPFPSSASDDSVPALTPVERNAFSELANRLTARLRGPKDKPEQVADTTPPNRRAAPARDFRQAPHPARGGACDPHRRRPTSAPSSTACRSAFWSIASTS